VFKRIYLTRYIRDGASLSKGVRVTSISIADAGGVQECFKVGAQDRLSTQCMVGCLGHPVGIETASGRR
jgi:L-alanine-DL-glutamate epimerase-like enolase superfamily enzyme